MANAFLTADKIAAVVAAIVGQDLNLAGRVYRDLAADFGSGSGATVKVRVPGAVAAHTRALGDVSTPLVSGEIAEQSIDVTLTEHVYNLVTLSEGALDLEIEDFAAQVLRPQATAIVRHVEQAVASAMHAVPATDLAYDEAAPAKLLTKARAQLRTNGLGADAPLIAAVGANVYAALLDGPANTFDADGKVRGFEVIESTRLDADEVVAFTPNAFALAVRAPSVPDGAPHGASVATDAFAVRHIRSFDATVAADRSLVSAFVGVKALPLPVDREDGTVELVANGGVVRVDTAA